jgi:hypothetical protein
VSLPWVYCIDFWDNVGVPADYPYTTITHDGTILASSDNMSQGGFAAGATLNSLALVDHVDQVAWLLATFADGATTAAAQIGLQAAIWNVIYDGHISLASGNVAGASSAYNTDLAALQAAVTSSNVHVNLDQFLWLSPKSNADDRTIKQGLVTKVPEPGSLVFLGAFSGIALLGFFAKRALA